MDGFIRQLGFQVWSKGHTPADVVNYWLPSAFEEPIEIGSCEIFPGDFLLADDDGVVIVPQSEIETVLLAAEAAIAQENKVRTAILSGMVLAC